MKFKVGDKVKIIDRTDGHGYEIGQEVTIESIDTFGIPKTTNYHCRSKLGVCWYLVEAEMELVSGEPTYTPHVYTGQKLEYGKYLVVRKDGKTHFEVYNGTGWAYNHKVIETFYLPKIA